MTNDQIQLVQRSFELVTPVLESATATFYDRLFQLDPSLRSMFRSPKEEQARKLAHVLTVVVKGLNKVEQILPAVEQLGRRHSGYGVRPEHYATVGAALLWTLQSGLGEAFTPEVRDAWASAYSSPPRCSGQRPKPEPSACLPLPSLPKRRFQRRASLRARS